MLGPCWVIWWALWASMEVSRGKKKPSNKKVVRWGLFWVTFCDYVGPMLGRFGSMLGPFWVIWWALWASMEVSGGEKAIPTGKLVRWRSFWGLCRANVGPLGPCRVIWWPERSFQKLLHGSLFGQYGNFYASIQIAEHMVLEPPFDLEPPLGKFFVSWWQEW